MEAFIESTGVLPWDCWALVCQHLTKSLRELRGLFVSVRVKEYCIKKRFKWSDCAARTTCKENEYYEDLMRYLRKNLAVWLPNLPDVVLFVRHIVNDAF